MKKIGIVGGIGPASTVEYYNRIIEIILSEKGKYPEIVIDSIDMNALCSMLAEKKYSGASALILDSLNNLKSAGADFAIITANTAHIVFDEIKASSPLPLISIIETARDYVLKNNYKRLLLLGTEFTMRSGMFEKIFDGSNSEVFIPTDDIDEIYSLFFPNLENGIIIDEDKKKLIEITEKYIHRYGIDAVILGCTEIPLMIKRGDLSVPVVDTTKIHIDAAVSEIMR